MSAAGGGRSFQVVIDLILKGVPQAQAGFSNLTTQLSNFQRATTGATGPTQALERQLVNTGRQMQVATNNAGTFSASLQPLQATTRATGAAFQVTSGQLQMMGGTAATAGTSFSPLVSAISQAGVTANTTAGSMSRMSAMGTALRENVRSMIFPIGGMIGALNEAAFMSGRVADMQAAQATAQAEVTRLTELGLEGTTQYSEAQKELERATRALNFTTRIATQSWFDVVFFMGSLVGAATGVIARFNELKGAVGVSTGALNAFSNVNNTAIGRLKALGTGMGNAVGGLASLASGFVGVGKNAKLAQNSLGQTTKVIGLSGRISQSASNAWTALSAAITGGSLVAGRATGALGGLGKAMSTVKTSGTSAATGIGALSTATAAGTGAMGGMAAATGVAASALGAAIGTMIAVDANLHGAGDAADTFTMSLFDLVGASDESKAAALANMDAVGKERLEFWKTIPIIGEWVKEITKHNEIAPETEKAMVGVADATKVVGVAVDGTLVPLQDLQQANLNAGATAGLLLEQAGLLGAGMKILGTDMTLAGDQAVFLANAYLQTEASSIKATQEAYNLVVAHQGIEKTMSMTTEQVMALAAHLEEQGVKVEEVAEKTETLTAAQQRLAAQAEISRTAFADYNAEAVLMRQGNLDAIAGLTQLGTKFDENAVAIAATNEGMTEYRATQIAAFADTRKTAEALGFQGEAYKATTAELLNYIANAQQQNDVNADGVASYLELSQANRDYLATLGLTSSVMGEVSDGIRDLSEQESLLIQVMSGVEEASARNVDGMVELVVAGEDVNRVIGLTNEQIAAELQALEASGEAHELTAEAIQEHADAMAELDPMIQNVAKAWGIYTAEGANANEVNRRLTDELLPELQSRLEDVRSRALEFAEAVGVDTKTAYSMSTEELVNYIANLENLPAEFETAGEAAKRAAEEFEQGWVEVFDRVKEAQDEWASNMTSALDTVADEFSEEFEGIGTDAKEKFKGGIAFDEQFWNEAFPQGMARAAFDKNVDVEDIIEDTKELIDSLVEDGLIDEQAAEDSFYPFINWMETHLPEDTRQAMAMLNAAMPALIEEFGRTIVEGIGELDDDTVNAFNIGIVEPAANALRLGFGPESMASLVLDNVEALIPQIEDNNPKFAAAFKYAMVDPITGQKLPAEQAIQNLLNIFYKAPEEFGSMIDLLDQDGDRVADIVDSDMVTPVQQSVNDIVADWNSLPPAAGTAASDATNDFKTNWLTGATSMNLAAGILPKLDEIPPAAGETGGEASSQLVSRFGELPPGVAEVVTRTADEFAVLKDKLVTQGTLIGGALNIIALTFTKLRDYANGPQGLGGIGVGVNYGPMYTELQVALATLNTNTVIGLAAIMASWMLHFQALLSYIPTQMGLVTQMFSRYFPLINQATTQGLGLMLTTWINHFTALNAYIPTQLGLTTQIFSQYLPLINTAVILGLGNVMLAWINHFTALNATIPVQLGITAQVFTQYMALVNTAVILGLGSVMLTWVNHFTALSAYVNQTFPIIIGTFNTWLATAATQTLTQTTAMSGYWIIHSSSVSATVGILAGHMGTLASEYGALSSGVNLTMSNISGYWITHASSVFGSIRMVVGHMVNLAREYISFRNGVRQVLNDGNQQWQAHRNIIRAMSSQSASSVSNLARSVSSNMRSIVSSMRAAMAAANALRASINRLQNKTITVTTRYRTVGSRPGAARGFDGVVNRPTDIHVGEGGRPELVQVTPLQGTAGARLNGMAAFKGLNASTIRAANGIGAGVDDLASVIRNSGGSVTNPRRHIEITRKSAGRGMTTNTNTVRKPVMSAMTAGSSQQEVVVSRGGRIGGGGTTVIDNRIILDSIEMKRWIRKTSNENYRGQL